MCAAMNATRRGPWILIVLALLAVAADEEAPPERLDALLKACKREKSHSVRRQEQVVADLSKWAREVQRGKIVRGRETKAPTQFNSEQDKQAALDDAKSALERAKKLLAEYKSGEALTPPTLAMPPKSGNIGILEHQTVRVVEVLDERTMRVEVPYSKADGSEQANKSWLSYFIKTAPKMIPATGIVVVRGVPTTKLGNNSMVHLDQVFEVAGTAHESGLSEMATNPYVLDVFDLQLAEARRNRK
jgi:hypothetical protein